MKIIRDIGCVLLVAMSWVGTLFLLKFCFNVTRDISYFQDDQGYLAREKVNLTDKNTNRESTTTSTQKSIVRNKNGEEDYDYNENDTSIIVFDSPFFAAWYFSTLNILFFPIYVFGYVQCQRKSSERSSARKLIGDSINQFIESDFTAAQFLTRLGGFSVLWMLTHYMLIAPLRILDTTVVLCLFSCTLSISYMLNWVVLHQQFVGVRIVAVIICDIGLALFAYMDGVQEYSKLMPVVVTFGAALGAAVYKVFYKRLVGITIDTWYGQMALFFSLVGLVDTFILWPIILLLYFSGLETLYWSQVPWLPLTSAALLFFLVNLLCYLGPEFTHESLISLGMVIAIPISFIIDMTMYDVVFEKMKLAGVLLTFIGFLIVLLPDNWNELIAQILGKTIAKWKGNEKKLGRVHDISNGIFSIRMGE